jgi:hypothetical protein
MPKENNGPIGEISPNLVTLASDHVTALDGSLLRTNFALLESGMPDFYWYNKTLVITKPWL